MSGMPAPEEKTENQTDESAGFVSFPHLIQRTALENPGLKVLTVEGTSVTWGQLILQINQVANMLKARGLGRGDKVAVLARSSIDYMTVFLGSLQAGVCIVPLSGMASSIQLAGMIRDSGAKLLFASGTSLELIDPYLGSLATIAEEGYIAFDFQKPGWQGFSDVLQDASTEYHEVDIQPDDAFNLIYSSGTTGIPKGIEQSHYMRYQHVIRFQAAGLETDAVTMIATALYSNTTLVALLPTLALGGRVVLMPKFETEEYLILAEKEKATHTMLVPVQYQRLLAFDRFDDFDLSSFKVKLSTSAPLRVETKRDIVQRWPGKMFEIYGLTEGGIGTMLSVGDYPEKLSSVGKPGEGAEICIINESGDVLETGEVGEVVGRSRTMMTGYHNRPDLTEKMIWKSPTGQVFYKSGDMGRLDEDGFLYLLDRKKDMILSGGFNIYAADIEAELLMHPEVCDVAVIAVPSEQWGETPLGLVVLNKGSWPAAAEIKSWVNGRLGKAQRVSEIIIRDTLPRSSIGKILKRELREQYKAETGG